MQTSFAPPASPVSHTSIDEKGIGDAQDVDLVTTPQQRLLTIGINLLILIELTIAMYMASRSPETFTPTFFTTFLGLAVPSLLIFWLIKWLMAPKAAKPAATQADSPFK